MGVYLRKQLVQFESWQKMPVWLQHPNWVPGHPPIISVVFEIVCGVGREWVIIINVIFSYLSIGVREGN